MHFLRQKRTTVKHYSWEKIQPLLQHKKADDLSSEKKDKKSEE